MGPMAVRGSLGKGVFLSSREALGDGSFLHERRALTRKGGLTTKGPLAVVRMLGNGSLGNRRALAMSLLALRGGSLIMDPLVVGVSLAIGSLIVGWRIGNEALDNRGAPILGPISHKTFCCPWMKLVPQL